jgi:OmpA-OmpF porin, OOP family
LVAPIATGCKFKAEAKMGEQPAPAPPPAPAPAPEPPKPAPKKFGGFKFNVDKEGKLQLPGPILFQTGTAILDPASDVPLNVVLNYMNEKKEITKLRIEGHTDTDDTNANNYTLSKNRAMAVAAWLIGKGVDCHRLVPVGFGEEKLLVNPEKTPEDKAQNRRVVFVNAEVNGKAVGGMPIDGGPPGQIAGEACK